MRLSTALNQIANNSVTEIQSLSEILEPNIVNEGLCSKGGNTSLQDYEGLPDTLQARLLTTTIKGKPVQILASMTGAELFTSADIVDLYVHRWELELGFREMKQYLLHNKMPLRSQQPELIKQEL